MKKIGMLERKQFFEDLSNTIKINYPEFCVKDSGVEHFDIYKMGDLPLSVAMVNVRVIDGYLKDINIFLGNSEAKRIYDCLKDRKDEIELQLGYKLYWDRNNAKNATRIGRFGKRFKPLGDYEPYYFELDSKLVASELVKIYNVFIPKVKGIVNKI